MDEINKTPGAETAPNPINSSGDNAPKPANGHTAESRPATRSITSKRVVIPDNLKRAAKPATLSTPAEAGAPIAAPSEPTPLPIDGQASAPQDITYTPNTVNQASSEIASAFESETQAEPRPATESFSNAEPLAPAASPVPTTAFSATAHSTSAEPTPIAAKTAAPDSRVLIPGVPSEAHDEPTARGRGLTATNLPYRPAETGSAPIVTSSKQHNRVLEIALWAIALLLLAATAYFVVPLFFPNLFSNPGSSSPATATAQIAIVPTKAASPTTTRLPTLAPTKSNVAATSAPLIIPTPPSDGEQISLLPNGNLSGWVSDGSPNVNYADPNIVAGTSEGKAYTGILQFNLRNLPTDTRLLFAVLELTGRDNTKLGATGEWQFEVIENPIGTDWSTATPEQITLAKSLGVIGTLKANALGNGVLNRIFFDESQMQLLAQQFKSGNLVLRIRGPRADGDNLFAWESGVGGSAVNAPTLHLVAVPGHYVIITNTPPPRNVLTAAAYVVRGTDAAKRNGTPTPFSPGVATATPGGEQVEIPIETALPGNDATAVARSQLATAIARTTGTYTPTPKGVIFIFPTFTPVVIAPDELATATPIPDDVNLVDVPIDYEKCNCQGRILLYSNRYGGEKPYPIMINPDGTELGKLSGDLYYRLAAAREQYSPDRQRRIIYPNDSRGIQQIAIQDIASGDIRFLTKFTKGVAYDGAWAPDGSAIAFVATESDNSDQIYLYDLGSDELTLLVKTPGGQPWFKRPTWSPDSQQIAFWSSVSGRKQIWVMNRDGSNQINISNNSFSEFDPVWVK